MLIVMQRQLLRISLCGMLLFIGGLLAHEHRQPTSDLSCLLQQAPDTQKRLVMFLDNLPCKAFIIDPGIKGIKTINQLLATRWNNDASCITDYARATVGVENFFQVYECLEAIRNSSLEIVEVQDNFQTPYPENYRDINVVFRDRENGHLGEIQINTRALIEYKNKKGHDLFDEIRNIKAQVFQEGRTLSREEQEYVNKVTQESKNGYDNALRESMKIGEKTLRVGVYGLLVHNNEILMVRTQSGSKIIYNFPGGGVDSHEGFTCALVRECQEEIGTHVEVKKRIYASQDVYIHPDFPKSLMFNLYYHLEVADVEQLHYHTLLSDAKWFPLSNLPIEEMLPNDVEFINYYVQKLGK